MLLSLSVRDSEYILAQYARNRLRLEPEGPDLLNGKNKATRNGVFTNGNKTETWKHTRQLTKVIPYYLGKDCMYYDSQQH